MALQPAAKLGKKCNACGTWNRPHPVGNDFDPGQKCFMPSCKCILYQGMAKDKYPGKHHRPSEPKGSRASGTSSVGGAGTALRNTRQPMAPAAVGAHGPSTSPPWGANRFNKMAKDLEALRKENELLRAKGSDKESEPEPGEAGGNDHSKVVKECRAHLAKCKSKVAEAQKDEDKELLSLLQPREEKAQADLQTALDQQQAAKPVDQRQRELEKEVRRLEGNSKQQDNTNTELAKKKEEAVVAEAAGLQKATELKEQLAQAKKKLEAAKQEQAPAELPTPSLHQQTLPWEGEGQDSFVQRRMEVVRTTLPSAFYGSQQAQLQESFLQEYKVAMANSSGLPPRPEVPEKAEDLDEEMDIDDIDDKDLDDLHLASGAAGDGDAAERRSKQRENLKAQKQKGGSNRVLQNLIKTKRGGTAAAAKPSDLR